MFNAPSPGAKVILGISGGVDSAVAAHLLIDQGYRVEGLFMKNWDEDDGTEYCTALADLADAERVCQALKIPLHTANFAAEYWDDVFADFLIEYRAGRTPNPDVLCNREIKFKQFADYAEQLGGDFIATGHYAIGVYGERGFELHKGVDANKDQSYFLQAVSRERLARCLFPLGSWQKSAVRDKAAQVGLHNHQRKDSTGICFIGERRFADFLRTYLPDEPGDIVDGQGRRLGQHRGLHYYTVGQRQGLQLGGLAGRAEAPWYVAAKNLNNNELLVSQDSHHLSGSWLRAREVNWLDAVTLPETLHAKIRYRQTDQSCTVMPAADGAVLVRFDAPQRAIAPGQYVAFYRHDRLLGGGKIDTADPRGLLICQ